jgi:sulfur carrier protein ThiS
MTIEFALKDQVLKLEEKSISIRDAMKALQLSPQAYLAVKDGVLLNEGDVVRAGEVVRLVAVISGGAG